MTKSSEEILEVSEPKEQPTSAKELALAALFGLAFGFLLQKGGVAKFNVLIGVLLLEDFTVVKVMMSAIIVGMLGIFTLHALGKVKLHIQPTRLGAQILGGLTFGVGFALLAYCPGTGAAALGQGNWDALFGIAGLMAGSYLFAELSEPLSRTVQKWGEKGKLTFPDVLHAPRAAVVLGTALVLTAALVVLERFTTR
jgi:uncharacterized membrane protein YedE/YeeE